MSQICLLTNTVKISKAEIFEAKKILNFCDCIFKVA